MPRKNKRTERLLGYERDASNSYVANAPLIGEVVFQNSGVTKITTSRSHDYLNRLTAVQNSGTGVPPVSFNYLYNAASQRTAMTNEANEHWNYQYDALGQVTNAWKYDANANVINDYRFACLFDDIGNRRQTFHGLADGSLALTNYTANLLNQYTNLSGVTRLYDADGNLTNDGSWTLTWDAENRLVKLAAATGAGPQISLQLDYDHQGRRIRQRVWNNQTWSGNPTNDVRYVYDGWNLLASLNPASAVRQSYLWGLDLSGTMQGAGGVGGLLAITDTSQGSHFCAYDGNGNVSALVKADGAGLAAQYEYGPFGEVLRATGPMAKANPFRFSTKYQDDETDLLYYGYRYYNASTRRWPNRDRIEEFSFRGCYSQSLTPKERFLLRQRRPAGNEFVFVDNHPVNSVDPYGLTTWIGECEICSVSVVLGVLFIDCHLTSLCGIGSDKHSERGSVKAAFFQAEVGLPVNCTISGNTFVSPPGTDHTTFNGWADAYGASWATGPIGAYTSAMTLGGAEMQGIGGEQSGGDLGMFMAKDRSRIRQWSKTCCK